MSDNIIMLCRLIIPFFGTIGAVIWSMIYGFTTLDITLFLIATTIKGLGVTVGFHRLFAHRSFAAHQFLRAALGVLGTAGMRYPVIRWVAQHRMHHRFSDQNYDPHTPIAVNIGGRFSTLRKLWHAHAGWYFFSKNKHDLQVIYSKYARDLLKDKTCLALEKNFFAIVFCFLLLPSVIGFYVTKTWEGAFSAFLWGGLVSMFTIDHIDWSVNSFCHYFGKSPFNTGDNSKNNFIFGILAFGEGWHNNHHAFPRSARHGLGRFQFDLSYWVIVGFQKIGWITDPILPSERAILARKFNEQGVDGHLW